MLEGILPVWKEKGMTSFACVSKVRYLLNTKKVGHAGTLDPDVEGVLPIAVGRATRVLEFMLEADKAYTGEITVGYSTTTEDASGDIVERVAIEENKITAPAVDQILDDFTGTLQQTPPMYSAVRVNGKRLYEYAFEGLEIERPTREVNIYKLERTSKITYDREEKTARFSFKVACGKGTYVRTLAVDIGKALGYPAHMSQLTRVQSGSILAEQTSTLKEIEEAVNTDTINNLFLSLDYGLEGFKKVAITNELWKKVKHGQLLQVDEIQTEEFPVLLTYQDKAVALYDLHASKKNLIKPRKVFRTEL